MYRCTVCSPIKRPLHLYTKKYKTNLSSSTTKITIYHLPHNNHNLKYISIVTFCQKVCVEIFNSHESSIFLIHVNKLNFCCAISLPHEYISPFSVRHRRWSPPEAILMTVSPGNISIGFS